MTDPGAKLLWRKPRLPDYPGRGRTEIERETPAPSSLVAAPFSSGETRAWAAGEELMSRVHAGVTMFLGQEAFTY